MHTRIFQLIKIASVFSLPVVMSDARAQEVESEFGKSYFNVDQEMTYAVGRHEFEPVSKAAATGTLIPHSYVDLNREPRITFEFQHSIELRRSEAALREIARAANNFEIPESFELSNSDLLIARWENEFLGCSSTKFLPTQENVCADRPVHDHLNLVWTTEGFELHSYKGEKYSGKCGSLPPARCVAVIPLKLHSLDTTNFSLVLVANQSRLLPLYVILSNDGTVRTAMSPNGELSFESNWQNTWANSTEKFSSFLSAVD